LVEEWLKQVMVRAVEERDVDVGTSKCLGRFKPPKPSADDHNTFLHALCMEGNTVTGKREWGVLALSYVIPRLGVQRYGVSADDHKLNGVNRVVRVCQCGARLERCAVRFAGDAVERRS
jgi:hypothetical protein